MAMTDQARPTRSPGISGCFIIYIIIERKALIGGLFLSVTSRDSSEIAGIQGGRYDETGGVKDRPVRQCSTCDGAGSGRIFIVVIKGHSFNVCQVGAEIGSVLQQHGIERGPSPGTRFRLPRPRSYLRPLYR